jgi:hypothetical protein
MPLLYDALPKKEESPTNVHTHHHPRPRPLLVEGLPNSPHHLTLAFNTVALDASIMLCDFLETRHP